MKDYSQAAEQPHILKAFEGRPPGRLLDIGAWNPFTFSHSRALIEMGWFGVLVEPSPGPASEAESLFVFDDPQLTAKSETAP